MGDMTHLPLLAAESWWRYMVHATWQAALAGLVLYTAVWLLRRQPAPLRYGLLIVALLKFAIPPMLALPTGAFSFASVSENNPVPTASATAFAEPELSSNGANTMPSPTEGISRNDQAQVRNAALPAFDMQSASTQPSSILAAAQENASARSGPEHGAIWKIALLAAHILGSIAMLAWVLASYLAFKWTVRRAAPNTDPALDAQLHELASRMAIRGRVRLLVSNEGCAPVVFGLLRPTILLPQNVIGRLSPKELSGVIAHELAHVRRHDIAVIWFENLLLLVWWFNPVLWMLVKASRTTREECCDDLVLATQIVDNSAYCDSLVRAASTVARPSRASAALGFAEALHPLGNRLIRIMDFNVRRAPGLSLAGLAVVLSLAFVALPGLREASASQDTKLAQVAAKPGGGDEKASGETAKTCVMGRVTDIDGNPIAGARLVIKKWESGPQHYSEIRSDAKGTYSLDAPPSNSRLFVYADGYAAMYRTHDVLEGVNRGWDFVLTRSAHISGRIIDTKGKPAPGRVIELWSLKSGPPPAPDTYYYASGGEDRDSTNDNGEFDMPNVAPGRHRVIVYRESPLGGDRSMEQEPVKGRFLTAESGKRIEDFTIVVNPPEDFVIAGHVRDASGNPVPGIGVGTFIPHGRHWWTKTDDKGAYYIEGLDGIGQSKFRLYFNAVRGAEGYKLVIPDVPLNARNVDFVLPGHGSILGTVRNAKTDERVTTYEVSVPVLQLPDSGAIWEEPQVQVTRGQDATFTISNVPAGDATVEVRAEGLGAQRFLISVKPDETVPLDCAMAGPAVFTGMTLMNDEPRKTTIVIGDEWLESDDKGNFSFDKYPNGKLWVWFFVNDGWHRSVEVELKSGETTQIDQDVGGSCKVRGTVRFADNEEDFCSIRLSPKPAPDGWYEFGRPAVEECVLAYSIARKSGDEYRLDNIPPGHWYVMAGSYRPSKHRSLLAASKEVDLKEGETLSLDFDLINPSE
ncbi:MAG: M56 family metallopeptidase [Candidatus Hydrogenedentales bacterium]|jgi:beta-lactamase regulating signal transducer with metallopeptidase domain